MVIFSGTFFFLILLTKCRSMVLSRNILLSTLFCENYFFPHNLCHFCCYLVCFFGLCYTCVLLLVGPGTFDSARAAFVNREDSFVARMTQGIDTPSMADFTLHFSKTFEFTQEFREQERKIDYVSPFWTRKILFHPNDITINT